MENIKIANTPYDDVFRTLLNDCSPLILPVINEGTLRTEPKALILTGFRLLKFLAERRSPLTGI